MTTELSALRETEHLNLVRAYNALGGAIAADDHIILLRAIRDALDCLRLAGEYSLADRLRQIYTSNAVFIQDLRDLRQAVAGKFN